MLKDNSNVLPIKYKFSLINTAFVKSIETISGRVYFISRVYFFISTIAITILYGGIYSEKSATNYSSFLIINPLIVI